MNKSMKDFEPEFQKKFSNVLSDQIKETFNKMEETAKSHTQHTFLVNAGGATAVLAFIGTKTGTNSAIWPLFFFVIGVIACGVQLLMMVYVHKFLFNDAIIRRNKFYEKDATLEDITPKVSDIENLIYQKIASWACFTAHGSFIVGVIIGGISYFYSGS
ncbi:MAG: hypothetical protein H8D23_27700 [Candidatus Brocadiales bacterium]|nr:hypothetical protein [Candidatus Brocadiales bacterium]